MIDRVAHRLRIHPIVLALSLARLGDAIGNSILFIVIPLYVAHLPAPWCPFKVPVRVGILIALFGLVNVALQPVMGMISDRLGRRKLLIQLGLLGMALSTLGFVIASRFFDLVLLRSLQAVGFALSIPAALALMATASDRQNRGGVMGVYTTMRMLGFAIGPLIGGFLFDWFGGGRGSGFEVSFLTAAGFIILGLILVQVWVKEEPQVIPDDAKGKFRIFDRKLLSAGIIGSSLATFVMANDFALISALENEFNERLDQGATGFGIAFSALMVSRLFFQIPLGRASDKIGRKPMIIAGFILIAPATYLLGEVTTTLEFTGLRLVQGLASASIAAPLFALAADISSPGREAQQMSILTMGFGLGIALGPLLAGILAVVFFELPFIVGGVMSLVAAWVVHQYLPETVISISSKTIKK